MYFGIFCASYSLGSIHTDENKIDEFHWSDSCSRFFFFSSSHFFVVAYAVSLSRWGDRFHCGTEKAFVIYSCVRCVRVRVCVTRSGPFDIENVIFFFRRRFFFFPFLGFARNRVCYAIYSHIIFFFFAESFKPNDLPFDIGCSLCVVLFARADSWSFFFRASDSMENWKLQVNVKRIRRVYIVLSEKYRFFLLFFYLLFFSIYWQFSAVSKMTHICRIGAIEKK